jgi:uncharacterized iron-regulated membrane protein
MLRKTLFWLHLAAGVSAGAVILIMCVTGVLLTYEKDITAWADARQFSITPKGGAALSVDEIVDRARAGRDDGPAAITLRSDPSRAAEVSFGSAGTLFIDPYTGAVLGREAQGTRAFFRSVTDWHRWLARPQSSRATGRAITGASNLVFLFIVLSGMYLWIPRVWSRVQFRNVAWFRRGLSSKARDFNWHNVVGIWASIPLAIVVASGAVISYPWAGDLVYRLAGETPPARSAGAASTNTTRAASPEPGSLDAIVQVAKNQRRDWRTISMRLRPSADGRMAVTIDAGRGGQPQKRGTLIVDSATAAAIKYEDFGSLSTGRRTRSWMRFAHTGEVYGRAGQTVAGLASLAGAVLVWTGIAMGLRRLAARLRRRSSAGTLRRAA